MQSRPSPITHSVHTVAVKGATGLNVHIYPSNLNNESRIFKIAKSIVRNGIFAKVEVFGKHEHGLAEREALTENVELVRLTASAFGLKGAPARVLKVLTWYGRAFKALLRVRPNCINAHSLPVLPLCAVAKIITGARLVYDTHELETEVMRSKGLLRVLYKFTEAAFIGFCDEISVVNAEIADWYKRRYGFERVWVVENVPEIKEVPPERSGALRSALCIAEQDLIFLYQGLLSDGRGLRKLLNVFRDVPKDRHLVVMGYGPLAQEIKKASAELANVHYHDAVPVDQLPAFTVDADVGFSLIENACQSYYLSLPNKVFEYMSCGVPVIASDFPVTKRVLESKACGWIITPQEDAIRNLVISISREDIVLKSRLAKTARETIGWKYQEIELTRMYSRLLTNIPLN